MGRGGSGKWEVGSGRRRLSMHHVHTNHALLYHLPLARGDNAQPVEGKEKSEVGVGGRKRRGKKRTKGQIGDK
jgi:hypothetical protein